MLGQIRNLESATAGAPSDQQVSIFQVALATVCDCTDAEPPCGQELLPVAAGDAYIVARDELLP
jgi:hypothetical protein